MRLTLFNQLLLTPLAFQIQQLNRIQSREKELLEGAGPSRGMHGHKGWDNVGRGGQEAPGDDPTFPCPMEDSQPSDPAALDQTALESSGIYWHLVLPTCVQLIPTSKPQSQSQHSWSWSWAQLPTMLLPWNDSDWK